MMCISTPEMTVFDFVRYMNASGQVNKVLTHSIEELLATKLRALYQRKKGRDLYDLWYVFEYIENLNIDLIVDIFEYYMKKDDAIISRKDFELNLLNKNKDIVFNADISPLLTIDERKRYNHDRAYDIALNMFISKLK